MPDTGTLNIRLDWDGHLVRDVAVTSSRPQAYRILTGQSVHTALTIVPLLYSVCGKAQLAAASAAITAAQGLSSTPDHLAVSCEAMQEHLWRLLLDWPTLLGLPPCRTQFIRWHGALKAIAQHQGDAQILKDEFHHELLGMSLDEWQKIDCYAKFNDWQKSGRGLLSAVFAALDATNKNLSIKSISCEFPPSFDDPDSLKALADHLNHEFAAQPHIQGMAMETGALADQPHSPLLLDVLRHQPNRLMARLIAKLADLLDSASALTLTNNAGRIQSVSVNDMTGLSRVKTARGMLLHYVKIESAQIASYLITAPTEWNFHPQGALVQGLKGLIENDKERLMKTIKACVLSLDPCVEYKIEINHA